MNALAMGAILKGRYRIINTLYQSKFTNVYTAEDLHLKGKIWAVREIVIAGFDQSARLRLIIQFQAEILKFSAIQHPNYGKIIDYFSLENHLYIIREYIPGIDILTILNQSKVPFPEDRVLYWGMQLADVLHYLFQKKYPLSFFRDFKPESIILGADGNVKLIDLGLQSFYLEDHSQFLSTKFTPTDYSPPELFEEPPVFDERSLVYMLGLVMYWMITQKSPGSDPFNFPEPESINSKISPMTAELIKKAIQSDPKSRHQSLLVFKTRMQEASKNSSSTLKRWVAHGKPGKPKRASLRWLEILMMVVLGILLYLLFKWLF
jgi:eukaryotic-like serine/threonine-protein kinase